MYLAKGPFVIIFRYGRTLCALKDHFLIKQRNGVLINYWREDVVWIAIVRGMESFKLDLYHRFICNVFAIIAFSLTSLRRIYFINPLQLNKVLRA
jgi:hypothetical protein